MNDLFFKIVTRLFRARLQALVDRAVAQRIDRIADMVQPGSSRTELFDISVHRPSDDGRTPRPRYGSMPLP